MRPRRADLRPWRGPLPWADTDLLNARLGRLATTGPTERIVLGAGELAAYRRVSTRILAAWHDNDPLDRFMYCDVEAAPPVA